MLIRQAMTDDIDAINMQPEHFRKSVRSVDYLSGLINDEKTDFLLAVIGEEAVGFSLLFEKETKDISLLVPCKYAYIQDFVVKETCRNKGIGAELMDASKRWAKERGMDYLQLSVLPENKDARRFYRRHGLYAQMIKMECPLFDK